MTEALFSDVDIRYQHTDFYIVNKPCGASMHAQHDDESWFQGLSEALAEPLWPVHRLDKDTSGALIVARSAEAAAWFGGAFTKRQIAKFYLAVGGHKPKKKQGLIQGDMVKARQGSWRLTPTLNNPARTQFFSTSLATDTPSRLYLLKPLTGKTHQLRVAMKSLGAAIVGDQRYQGPIAAQLHLHAYALCFQDANGTTIECIIEPPATPWFKSAANALAERNWQQPWEITWPKVAELPRR